MRLSDLHKKWLEDPAYAAAYEELAEEFQLATFEILCRYDGPSMHEAPATAPEPDLRLYAHSIMSAAGGSYERALELLKKYTTEQEPL